MFLLDTNVVSELRRLSRADANVVAWINGTGLARQFLSVVVFTELELGVRLVERRDRVQGAVLRRWLDGEVLQAFAGRILPVDVAVARCAAGLQVPNSRPIYDTLIAATALVHDMTVVTRNVGEFQGTGIAVLNPWDAAA